MDNIYEHHVASICDEFSGGDIQEWVSQAFNLSFQEVMELGKAATDIQLRMTDFKESF